MLVVMHSTAQEDDIHRVCQAIEAMSLEVRPMPGEQRTAIGVVGNDRRVDDSRIRGLPGVANVIHVSSPYKQVSREWQGQDTIVELYNGVRIGAGELVVMGGPCAVENEEQIMAAAKYVAASGARVLRGGAFKPRSSPYSFQGLEEEGLKMLAKARKEFGLAVITEALDIRSADLVAEYADVIQIGARNMQNFALLRHVGRGG